MKRAVSLASADHLTLPAVLQNPDDPPAKQAVLATALHLFTRQGVAGTNVRQIAAQAGFTNPIIFKYFDSKEGLARVLFERCYEELVGTLFVSIDLEEPFLENIARFVTRYSELLGRAPVIPVFVLTHFHDLAPGLPARLKRRPLNAAFQELLVSGKKQLYVTERISIPVLVTCILGILEKVAQAIYHRDLRVDMASLRRELQEVLTALMRKDLVSRRSSKSRTDLFE
ncbi:MAG: TetR/AcrR family transcriptional regulator [Verrucomicrobia bacterium]|nr:TetR/AcrR family transcriptional regulator [Verrucomicrobiota bacterium]